MYDFASRDGGLGIGVEAAAVTPAKAREDRNVNDRTVNVRRIRGTPGRIVVWTGSADVGIAMQGTAVSDERPRF
jgi:hypothetical protein